MKNLWISDKRTFAVWTAKFQVGARESLVNWLQSVLSAGEKTEIYKVREAPQINYSYTAHGFISDFIIDRYKQTGILDIFNFAFPMFGPYGGADDVIHTRLAFYDRDSGIVSEADVSDTGQLIAELRPRDADRIMSMEHHRPIEIGPPHLLKLEAEQGQQDKTSDVEIYLRTYTDIWFPWVYGKLEENADFASRFSNKDLARHHTPRLNNFLREVKAATIKAGGSWRLQPETEGTRRDFLFMLNDTGVNIDAELPEHERENFLLGTD